MSNSIRRGTGVDMMDDFELDLSLNSRSLQPPLTISPPSPSSSHSHPNHALRSGSVGNSSVRSAALWDEWAAAMDELEHELEDVNANHSMKRSQLNTQTKSQTHSPVAVKYEQHQQDIQADSEANERQRQPYCSSAADEPMREVTADSNGHTERSTTVNQSATGQTPSHSTPITQHDATGLTIDDTQSDALPPPLPADVSFTPSLPSASPSPSPSPSRNRTRSRSPVVTPMTDSSLSATAAMNAATAVATEPVQPLPPPSFPIHTPHGHHSYQHHQHHPASASTSAPRRHSPSSSENPLPSDSAYANSEWTEEEGLSISMLAASAYVTDGDDDGEDADLHDDDRHVQDAPTHLRQPLHDVNQSPSRNTLTQELDCSSYIMDGSPDPDRTQPTQRLEAQLDRALMSNSASSSSTLPKAVPRPAPLKIDSVEEEKQEAQLVSSDGRIPSRDKLPRTPPSASASVAHSMRVGRSHQQPQPCATINDNSDSRGSVMQQQQRLTRPREKLPRTPPGAHQHQRPAPPSPSHSPNDIPQENEEKRHHAAQSSQRRQNHDRDRQAEQRPNHSPHDPDSTTRPSPASLQEEARRMQQELHELQELSTNHDDSRMHTSESSFAHSQQQSHQQQPYPGWPSHPTHPMSIYPPLTPYGPPYVSPPPAYASPPAFMPPTGWMYRPSTSHGGLEAVVMSEEEWMEFRAWKTKTSQSQYEDLTRSRSRRHESISPPHASQSDDGHPHLSAEHPPDKHRDRGQSSSPATSPRRRHNRRSTSPPASNQSSSDIAPLPSSAANQSSTAARRSALPLQHDGSGTAATPSATAELVALRQKVEKLTADATRLTARESFLTREVAARDRTLQSERERHTTVADQLKMCESELRELRAELASLKSSLASSDSRASNATEQVNKLRKALNDAQQALEKERQAHHTTTVQKQQLERRLQAAIEAARDRDQQAAQPPINARTSTVNATYDEAPNAQPSLSVSSSHSSLPPSRHQPEQFPYAAPSSSPTPTPNRRLSNQRNVSQLQLHHPATSDNAGQPMRNFRTRDRIQSAHRASAGRQDGEANGWREKDEQRPFNARPATDTRQAWIPDPIDTEVENDNRHPYDPQQQPSHALQRRSMHYPSSARPAPPRYDQHHQHDHDQWAHPSSARASYERRDFPEPPPDSFRDQSSSWHAIDSKEAEEGDIDALIDQELQRKHGLQRDLSASSARTSFAYPSAKQQSHRTNVEYDNDDEWQRDSNHREMSVRSAPPPIDVSSPSPSPSPFTSPSRPQSQPRDNRHHLHHSSPRSRHGAESESAAASGVNPKSVRNQRSTLNVSSSSHAPFATAIKTDAQTAIENELEEMQQKLSELLQKKERLEVELVRAARPGSIFDPSVLPPHRHSTVRAAGSSTGARSRHTMLVEGEHALAAWEKEIQAYKVAIRRVQAKINDGWR